MRRIITILALFAIALAPVSINAQTKDNTKAKTEQTAKDAPKKVKAGEPTNLVYKTKDGQLLPVYRGAKGGLFVIRTSGKTKNEYKQYVKEDQCQRK